MRARVAQSEAGFSLVETMIAMGIMLVVLAGAVVYLIGKRRQG